MLLDALRQGFTTGGSGVIKYLRSVDILGLIAVLVDADVEISVYICGEVGAGFQI